MLVSQHTKITFKSADRRLPPCWSEPMKQTCRARLLSGFVTSSSCKQRFYASDTSKYRCNAIVSGVSLVQLLHVADELKRQLDSCGSTTVHLQGCSALLGRDKQLHAQLPHAQVRERLAHLRPQGGEHIAQQRARPARVAHASRVLRQLVWAQQDNVNCLHSLYTPRFKSSQGVNCDCTAYSKPPTLTQGARPSTSR